MTAPHVNQVTDWGQWLQQSVAPALTLEPATGDAITHNQAEAARRLVPFQSYIGMRQALDLLTTDE